MQDLATCNASLSGIVRLAGDVLRLHIRPDDEALSRYRAGQFMAVHLPQETPRSYSMARAPRRGEPLELHVRLHPGGRFSGWLRDLEHIGAPTRLRISGPFGDCTWRECGDAVTQVLLLATGTGIAPLNALLEQAIDDGERMPITLYWGSRTPADFYLREHFDALAARLPGLRFVPVLSGGDPDWQGRHGHVQQAAATDHPSLRPARVYACGSAAMVEGARALFTLRHGLDPERFHADAFEPAAAPKSGAEARITVRLRQDGRQDALLPVPMARSLMHGLQATGHVRGICGGHASCGSCRIELSAGDFARMPPPDRTEARLLASLGDPHPTHRLACRIPVSARLDGLAFSLPSTNS